MLFILFRILGSILFLVFNKRDFWFYFVLYRLVDIFFGYIFYGGGVSRVKGIYLFGVLLCLVI